MGYVVILGGLTVAAAPRILTPADSRLRAGIPGLVEFFWAAAAAAAVVSAESHVRRALPAWSVLWLEDYLRLFIAGGPLSSAILWALGRGSRVGLAICAARYAVTFAFGMTAVALVGVLVGGCLDDPGCAMSGEAEAGFLGLIAGLFGLMVLIPAVSGAALALWPRPQQPSPAVNSTPPWLGASGASS